MAEPGSSISCLKKESKVKRAMVSLFWLAILITAVGFSSQARADDSLPQKQVQACGHKAAGDACSFIWPGQTVVSGTCLSSAHNTLVCTMFGLSEPRSSQLKTQALNTSGNISALKSHAPGGLKNPAPVKVDVPASSTSAEQESGGPLGVLPW
jgi:hypothetical protein